MNISDVVVIRVCVAGTICISDVNKRMKRLEDIVMATIPTPELRRNFPDHFLKSFPVKNRVKNYFPPRQNYEN